MLECCVSHFRTVLRGAFQSCVASSPCRSGAARCLLSEPSWVLVELLVFLLSQNLTCVSKWPWTLLLLAVGSFFCNLCPRSHSLQRPKPNQLSELLSHQCHQGPKQRPWCVGGLWEEGFFLYKATVMQTNKPEIPSVCRDKEHPRSRTISRCHHFPQRGDSRWPKQCLLKSVVHYSW